MDDREPVKRVPFEQPVDRIPAPPDVARCKQVVEWADLIHRQAHDPWGISWAAMRASLQGMGPLVEWAEQATYIDHRYRYRVDAPMDESELDKLGDTIPEDWGSGS